MIVKKSISIHAQLVDHSLTGARQAGIDVDKLLSTCDIKPQELQSAGNRIPVEKTMLLINRCVRLMRDEICGMLERPVPMGYFRLLALSVVHTRNLTGALQRYIEFHNLNQNSFLFTLNIGREEVKVELARITGHKIADNQAIDSLLTVLHRFLGWLCNDHIIPNQVRLDFSPPNYRSEYLHMYYGAPVLFNQDCISLSFANDYLEHPVVQNEASVENYVRRAPLDIYLPLNAAGEVSLEVRKQIQDLLAKKHFPLGLQELAARMRLNPQTLRRQLQREGSSYNNIKTQVRRDIAIHHLGRGETSIETIAEKVGYTEPSAFIRAFKAWTGFTPLQFKKGLNLHDID